MPRTDPSVQKENDRLDICHKMIEVMLDGKMHLAPIAKDPQRILDVGTGTGIWAIEMGKLTTVFDRWPFSATNFLTATLAFCR